MNNISEILMLMLAAILTENFIFTKFLGICPFLGVSDSPSKALGMGMAVTFVMCISSVTTWLAYNFILVPFDLQYLRTIAFILIIASLVQLIDMFLKKYSPALHMSMGIFLPLIATNCAILGAALINIERDYTLLKSIVFGTFSGLGFLVAIMIFAGIREKINFSDPPHLFKGIPIALVTAGFLAMAFAGFHGITIV